MLAIGRKKMLKIGHFHTPTYPHAEGFACPLCKNEIPPQNWKWPLSPIGNLSQEVKLGASIGSASKLMDFLLEIFHTLDQFDCFTKPSIPLPVIECAFSLDILLLLS